MWVLLRSARRRPQHWVCVAEPWDSETGTLTGVREEAVEGAAAQLILV